MIPIMILSTLAALVLLGLTVAVVYVAQLFRQAVFQEDVWRTLASEGEKKSDVITTEKEKLGGVESKLLEDEEKGMTVAAREIPTSVLTPQPPTSLSDKSPAPTEDTIIDDPDVPALPDSTHVESSVPAVREQNHDRKLGRAIIAWTYDNWVTHFMFALFGWMGVLLGGARDR